MIFDGRRGYVKGNLNLPNGTILAMIKGPIALKNYFNTATQPQYSITVTPGATGTVALQGTNDVAYQSNDDSRVTVSADLLPAPGAVWTDIAAAGSVTVSGSVATAYNFLRLIIVASGTGIVTNAWISWN
jgi:hypothetical protein